MRHQNFPRAVAVFAGALMLSACRTFSPDGGMSVAANVADQELRKDVVAIRTQEDASSAHARVRHLIKRPLTAETAVQISLLNNRGLQAAYNELGIAEATMIAESRPPNPKLSISRIASAAEIEIERKIVADILALATLPARAEIAQDRFRQAQLRAAERTIRVAGDARRSYYRAVASQQLAALLGEAQSAAANAAKLATRLGQSGALNKLDQAREQVFYAEITAQLATARQQTAGDRERLVRIMGLWGNDLAFRLPASLPLLPARPRPLPMVERDALGHRIDLQIARIEVETLAKSLGLSQATRFINVLELGVIDETTRPTDAASDRQRGVEVELQVPLFDFGETRIRAAEQTYMLAVNRLGDKAINIRSEARDAYRKYRSTYDIAAHYQREVLPLRKIISDEMMLRYGAMQVDVFALLTESRQRIAASAAALDARRNFWLASADLSAAIVGGGSGASSEEASNVTMPASSGSGSH
ncbi:MAG: TolC family protein [Deltaproteobacteria bacterium]|nr:TolC family protein [Deltaproteobacteria bacterium]